MVKDPVCGMEVDPGSAPFRLEHGGRTYYFCSRHCMEEFSKDPRKYLLEGPSGTEHHAHHGTIEKLRRKLLVSLLLSIPIFLSPMVEDAVRVEFPHSGAVQLASATILFLYGGSFFLKGALSELRRRAPGMMTLVSLGITTAFIYSLYSFLSSSSQAFYMELAMLIDIMLLGHYVEARALASATGQLDLLVKLLPSEAHLIRDSSVIEVPVSALKEGDLVLVKPGERIAADGVVEEGVSYVDESLLTGESSPVLKVEGSEVIGGSLNLEAPIKVRISRSGEESYLAQVERLMMEIRSSKSRYVELADRAAFLLTAAILIAGPSSLIYWLLHDGRLSFAVERMVAVMVVACPHALGLAVPVVVHRVTSLTSRRGILLKSKQALERVRSSGIIVFDKTGTLTKGRLAVRKLRTYSGLSEDDLLKLAASLEALSNHPIAGALVEEASRRGIELLEASDFRSIPGYGVEGKVEGREVVVASPNYFSELDLEGEGTLIVVSVEGEVAGTIELEDSLKEEAPDTVRELREMGYKVYMLTGDRRSVAERFSRELGLDGFYSEVKPHEKVEVIRELQGKGHYVVMVGDGINDAPALIQADLGIAIGSGTDIAVESADVVLVRNDLRDVVRLLKIARSAHRKMVENLAWTIGYNSLTVPLAAGALVPLTISPAAGAVIMSLSDLFVVLNASALK